jgi:hypothetical protein
MSWTPALRQRDQARPEHHPRTAPADQRVHRYRQQVGVSPNRGKRDVGWLARRRDRDFLRTPPLAQGLSLPCKPGIRRRSRGRSLEMRTRGRSEASRSVCARCETHPRIQREGPHRPLAAALANQLGYSDCDGAGVLETSPALTGTSCRCGASWSCRDTSGGRPRAPASR